jgi:hypothetical protein
VGKMESELSLLAEKVKSLSIAVKDEKLKVKIKNQVLYQCSLANIKVM